MIGTDESIMGFRGSRTNDSHGPLSGAATLAGTHCGRSRSSPRSSDNTSTGVSYRYRHRSSTAVLASQAPTPPARTHRRHRTTFLLRVDTHGHCTRSALTPPSRGGAQAVASGHRSRQRPPGDSPRCQSAPTCNIPSGRARLTSSHGRSPACSGECRRSSCAGGCRSRP